MYEPEGLQRLFEIVTGQSEDSLVGGAIVVSDGTNEASMVIDEWPWPSVLEDGTVRLSITATFGGDVANFSWAERRVATKEGVVLDRVTQDFGRKVAGQEWVAQVDLDLKPLPDGE